MRERIEAELMVPGRGEPVPDAAVVLDGDTILYAGPAATAPRADGDTVTRARTVMPGLWDCHTHFVGVRSLDLNRIPLEPLALRAARCVGDMRAALDAGYTSVREVGGLGVDLARAVAEGLVEGPAIYGAAAMLSTTGGHGDLHAFPLQWVLDHGHAGGEMRLCDGPAECARATREQLRRNARVIKVHASGGVLSEIDHPIHQQFTVAEMAAVVEVAGMAERVVAAHCHGKPGIMAALEAGVRTIEHGTFLDEESAVAMRECGAILVPTRTIVAEIAEHRVAPPYAQAKLDALVERHGEVVALAAQAGVRIAAGSDLACSGRDLPASWGRNGRELALLAQAGLTPLQVVEAATAAAPETLGPQAPRSGQLCEGYDADVIVVDGDPLADLGILGDPTRITGVWRAGRRVKG
jgi:imidazolonepropionase-like amidohydrolase